ncbi:SH3 domain protein [Dictyocaulus viviparus]|uniref:SH3 domain protein n=1 Tax=Dictyocaulus viviparus TaxID=29172 RepID=A0A0D8XS20_DICVI|nr:SH3 domain protein [Dictyocaulus viviparus]
MAADVLAPGFWEIGAYKNNVRRMKEGIEELDDFMKMVRERADIEAKYGKTMQQFADKWKTHVERAVTSGSIKRAWLQVMEEADIISIQHNRVRDRLVDEVLKTLALYRKENYHPSTFRAPKEIREAEEGFERAQRKWKKLYEKVEISKKAYYNACRQEKSASVNLNNSQADLSLSQDGLQKLRDRLDKCHEDVRRCKSAYEKNIFEITQYRAPYIEDMTFEFEKCQAMEMKRSKFFIEMMSATQQVLVDLARNTKFTQLHSNIENVLRSCDDNALTSDLQAWSSINGKDARTVWPVFEDYTESLRTIASRGGNTNSNSVILTKQITKTDDAPGPATISAPNSENGKSSDTDTNTFDSRKNAIHKMKPQPGQRNLDRQWENRDSPPLSTTTPDSAKYGDFEELHTKSIATVLYDYNPLENDEISLQKGETIEVLTDADSLGWCTGRKNGEVGLFPASYVQVM